MAQFNQQLLLREHLLKRGAQLVPPELLEELEFIIESVDLAGRLVLGEVSKLLVQLITHLLPLKDADQAGNLALNVSRVDHGGATLLRHPLRGVERLHILAVKDVNGSKLVLALRLVKQ